MMCLLQSLKASFVMICLKLSKLAQICHSFFIQTEKTNDILMSIHLIRIFPLGVNFSVHETYLSFHIKELLPIFSVLHV